MSFASTLSRVLEDGLTHPSNEVNTRITETDTLVVYSIIRRLGYTLQIVAKKNDADENWTVFIEVPKASFIFPELAVSTANDLISISKLYAKAKSAVELHNAQTQIGTQESVTWGDG